MLLSHLGIFEKSYNCQNNLDAIEIDTYFMASRELNRGPLLSCGLLVAFGVGSNPGPFPPPTWLFSPTGAKLKKFQNLKFNL